MKISEVAKLTGVTIRALHYYDEIGLLRPSETNESGYRIYNDDALEKLQQILFFRELDFSLSEINQIMSSPSFDKKATLKNHKAVLLKKRDRLDGLLRLVDKTIKGENIMSFNEFDTTEIERTKAQYAAEAKSLWGGTNAYAESEKKTAAYSREDWNAVQEESLRLFDAFAALRNSPPDSAPAQALVGQWQEFITSKYYACTNEILQGLGQMYIADGRFTQNIDKSGKGTAEFMSKAIAIYCAK